MAIDEDACTICEGDRSTKKNPIIFCDGEDCNIPVHKECYGVDQVPDGEWFCQRCDNKRRNKPTRTRCCPMQTGAFKLTTKPGDFIHVVCSRWNKAIDHEREPYDASKSQMDAHECCLCGSKSGICIKCEDRACPKRFHVTCGVNSGLIRITKNIPNDYSPRCSDHQSKDKADRRNHKRYTASGHTQQRRRLLQKDLIDSETSQDEGEEEEEEEEEEEGNDDADDDNDDDDDADEEEEEDEDDDDDDDDDDEEDEDMGTSSRKKAKTTHGVRGVRRGGSTLSLKRQSTALHGKKGGQLKLFLSDQSDSDDHMGTSEKKSALIPPRGSGDGSSSSKSPKNASHLSIRDRIEAKRRKSEVEKAKSSTPVKTSSPTLALDTAKSAPSTTATTTATIVSPVVTALNNNNIQSMPTSSVAVLPQPQSLPFAQQLALVTPLTQTPPQSNGTSYPPPPQQQQAQQQQQQQQHKQKLPNKAHLMPNQRPPTSNGGSPVSTPKRYGGSNYQPSAPGPVIKNLDELENDILAGPQQRRNGPSSSPATTAAPAPSIPPGQTQFDNLLNNIERGRKPSVFQGAKGPSDTGEYQKTIMRNKFIEIIDDVFSQKLQAQVPSDLQHKLQMANQELARMKEENRRLLVFKKNVTDVFGGLSVPVPSGLSMAPDTIEEYVAELQAMIFRTGIVQDKDMERITECVEKMVGREH